MDFRRGRKRKRIAEINVVPLINVVLLLLTFFIVSSTFGTRDVVRLQIPEAFGAQPTEKHDATLSLLPAPGGPDGKGAIYFDDKEIDTLQHLKEILVAARVERPDFVLMIRPDARVDTGRFLEILGVLKSAGIVRYQIPTESPAALIR